MELDYTISWRQLQLLLNYESRALRTPEACLVGSFGILGLTALWDSISLYIKLSPREREEEERNEIMSKQPPPAPTARAVGPCPTIIQISRRP